MENLEQKDERMNFNEKKENDQINALLYYLFYDFLFLSDIKQPEEQF